jgi:hypothetical protein
MREFTKPSYSGNNESLRTELDELQQENQEIVSEYVAELHKAELIFESLINQLTNGLAESRWDAIIGDDIRGRATALVIGKVARNYTEHLGLPLPRRLFIATGKHDIEGRQQLIENYVELIQRKLGNRVLFTTEYIESGETIQHAIAAFQRLGITCDVASAYIASNTMNHRTEETTKELRSAIPDWQGSLYVGEEDSEVPKICRHIFKIYDVMGVKKSSGRPTTIATSKLKLAEAQADGASEDEIAQLKEVHKLHTATIIKPVRQELTHLSDGLFARIFGS